MKSHPIFSSFRTGLVLAVCAVSAHGLTPTDNPVATYYGAGDYPVWTDDLSWDHVIDMSTYANGADNFEKFENARDELHAQGGGVLYYPAGTYAFTLPDTGYGSGIGTGSRGLMLKSGVIIRGADLAPGQDQAVIRGSDDPTDPAFFNNVTHTLDPQTVFVFHTQVRGKDPATNAENSAGEVPLDWNFIGMIPGNDEAHVGNVRNIGVVNVKLDGGFVFFGFHTTRSATLDSGRWFQKQWKANWPDGAPLEDTWAKRVPDGTHYMDCIHGAIDWQAPIEAGSGRLVFGVYSINGAPWDDMTHRDFKSTDQTVLPANGFHSYRYTGRIVAHGDSVFIANNVLAKPTKNFVHKMLQNSGNEEVILFDYANFIGIDVNKSNYGGHQNDMTVIGPNTGYHAPNVMIRDNWVFNRGNKSFEASAKWLVLRNNHSQRYYAENQFPYDYIVNAATAYPAATPATGINAGGISFDGFRWQPSESASDYMSRGYDLAGRHLWIDRNSVVNAGSRGNDGEGIMAQRHNNVSANGWAFTHNVQGRADFGVGTFGETGWIGLYDMYALGFLGWKNVGPGPHGLLDMRANPIVDTTISPNLGSGITRTPATTHAAPYNEDYQTLHSDPVSAPDNVNAVFLPGGKGALITWTDTAENELGFRVERRFGSGPWETIAYRPRQGLGKGSGLTTQFGGTAYPRVNQESWADYTVDSSMSPEYRVVAFNELDDDSTGLSATTAPAGSASMSLGSTVESGTTFKASIETVEGMWYQLQSSTNLVDWTNEGDPVQGDGSVVELVSTTVPVDGEAVYYRSIVSN